jgi:hypothetical protein
MPWTLRLSLPLSALITLVTPIVAAADDAAGARPIQKEIWALPLTLPRLAYVVHPAGKGPFRLVIMNHGVWLNARDRSFLPLVEFRDAALWFAAYTGAGGDVEYHLMPPFGDEGHFFVDSADAVPLWAPLLAGFSTSIREPPASQGDEHEGPTADPAAIDHRHGASVISAVVGALGHRAGGPEAPRG